MYPSIQDLKSAAANIIPSCPNKERLFLTTLFVVGATIGGADAYFRLKKIENRKTLR